MEDLEKPLEESEAVVEGSENDTTETREETSAEENKVPYSRFKKFHERAIRAEEEARAAKYRLEQLEREGEQPAQREESTGRVPQWWITLYGDSDATRRGWSIYQQENQKQMGSMREQLRQEAIQAVREEQLGETNRLNENLATIDDGLEDLSSFVGRDLTEQEQSGVLDIVDEFTPKGQDGNYLGAIMSFEKAWEVYEMRNQTQNAMRKESRNRVAGLTGSQSHGEPTSAQVEADKNFTPGRWGSWRDKLK